MEKKIQIYGGMKVSILPFLVFLAGAIYLGISSCPDEYGYWPIVTAALIVGMLVTKDKSRYADVIIEGMSQKMVMIMVSAWLFASLIGSLMYETGFVEALIWLCDKAGVKGRGFVALSFIIASIIGTSTGTSIGTIVTCTPILYPAGYLLGARPEILAAAILGGGAFGDNLSPISDTTIASAMTQNTDIGGVVKSRLKYALPAAFLAVILYFITGQGSQSVSQKNIINEFSNKAGLPMITVPVVIIFLCIRKRHLLEALFWGIIVGIVTGLVFDLISVHELFYLEPESHAAKGVVIDGLRGGIGVSIFTILLLGLVYFIKSAGFIDMLVDWSRRKIKNARQTDIMITITTLLTNSIIAHNTVTIVSLGEFAKRTGEEFELHPYRRANLLDVSANTLQHILPYLVTVIIASAYTSFGEKYGAPRLAPFTIGIRNFHSWMLLAVILFSAFSGYGRKFISDSET